MRNIELPNGQGYTTAPDLEIPEPGDREALRGAGITMYRFPRGPEGWALAQAVERNGGEAGYPQETVGGPWFGYTDVVITRLGRTELDWIQRHIEYFGNADDQ